MRIKNTVKNSFFSLVNQLVVFILSFIYRTVLLTTLGTHYLGITGLFGNIILLFSLAELGISSAITFSLYGPLAQNDEQKIQAIMDYYKRLYRYVALSVLAIGIAVVPFLGVIIKTEKPIENVYIIYGLYLFNSVVSYLFFAYRLTLITADQKYYKTALPRNIVPVMVTVLQIAALYLFKDFILIIIISVVGTLATNIWIAFIVKKFYPYIDKREKSGLEANEKKEITKNIRATVLYRFSQRVLDSTDNIVISSFLGIALVGVYSNYQMIVDTLKSFILSLVHPLGAGIGNLNATESAEKKQHIFNVLFFANFWVFSVCSVCFYVLIEPFITLWLGESFLLSKLTLIVLICNFFTEGMYLIPVKFREACGLFIYGKPRPVITAILNLAFSLILVQTVGIVGVFLGTLISRMLTIFWFEPYIVYKKVFEKGPLEYFINYLKYTAVTVAMALLTEYLFGLVWAHSIITFIYGMLIAFVVPNTILLLVFMKSENFLYYLNLIKPVFLRTLRRKMS